MFIKWNGQGSRRRLTEEMVEYIHNNKGKTHTQLAQELGCKPDTVWRVRTGRAWAHMHPDPRVSGAAEKPFVPLTEKRPSQIVQSSQTFDGIPNDIGVSSSLEEMMEKLGGGESRAVVHPPSVTGTAPILPTHISYPPDISNLKRLPGITIGREDTDDEMF